MDQGTPERMATLLGRDDAERARFCSLPGVRVQARMSDIGIASQWLEVAEFSLQNIRPKADMWPIHNPSFAGGGYHFPVMNCPSMGRTSYRTRYFYSSGPAERSDPDPSNYLFSIFEGCRP